VPKEDMESILRHCHSLEVGGHFGATKITGKVPPQFCFYWSSLIKIA